MKRWSLLPVGILLVAAGAFGEHLMSPGTRAATGSVTRTASVTTTKPVLLANTTTSSNADSISSAAIDAAFVRAYRTAGKSVVYVESVGTGSGSGVIYDSQGDIVTNRHVVAGASSLQVTLANGKQYPAKLLGVDAADDLAVIRIHASGLQPAQFATAGQFQVAQTVLAIGSPLGLKNSVTSGLISGLNRVEQEPNGAYLPNAIQTSAPINPGNSGGALITLQGIVVGMPTLEQTSTTSGAATQAIGFAIPSTRITEVANQIIATGKVLHTGRPYLGISPADPGAANASPYFNGGFGPSQGSTVPGAVVQGLSATGPAAKAGIQQGDTITAVNGQAVTDAQDLLSNLATHKPGDTVTLKINRNGSTQTLKVKLGELPS